LVFGPDEGDAYLQWVEQNVREDFPTLDELRNNVYAEYTVNVLFDPASLAENSAREAEARAREVRAHDELWRTETQRHARDEAIRQVEMERARQQINESTDVWAEAMDQLLSEMAGYIQALLGGLEKNGVWRGRALDQIDSMAETFRLLGGRNLGDRDIEDLIKELRTRKASKPADDDRRDAWQDQIHAGLVELNGHVSNQAAEVERRLQAHTRAGALEL
jgi:hypothetical protein